MYERTFASFALAIVVVVAGLAAPAHSQDGAGNFNAGWDNPNWVAESEPANRPEPVIPDDPDAAQAGAANSGAIRLGGSDVRLDSVAGAPGATVTPSGGNVSLGVGVAPSQTGEANPVAGFGALPAEEPAFPGLDNGMTGAVSVSETTGAVTQSFSLSGPVGEDGSAPGAERDAGNGFKTMFGLGLSY